MNGKQRKFRRTIKSSNQWYNGKYFCNWQFIELRKKFTRLWYKFVIAFGGIKLPVKPYRNPDAHRSMARRKKVGRQNVESDSLVTEREKRSILMSFLFAYLMDAIKQTMRLFIFGRNRNEYSDRNLIWKWVKILRGSPLDTQGQWSLLNSDWIIIA